MLLSHAVVIVGLVNCQLEGCSILPIAGPGRCWILLLGWIGLYVKCSSPGALFVSGAAHTLGGPRGQGHGAATLGYVCSVAGCSCISISQVLLISASSFCVGGHGPTPGVHRTVTLGGGSVARCRAAVGSGAPRAPDGGPAHAVIAQGAPAGLLLRCGDDCCVSTAHDLTTHTHGCLIAQAPGQQATSMERVPVMIQPPPATLCQPSYRHQVRAPNPSLSRRLSDSDGAACSVAWLGPVLGGFADSGISGRSGPGTLWISA